MPNVYDTSGLNLYYPGDSNDLILEYSTDDGDTWIYLSTVITGGVDTDSIEQKNVSITATGIAGEYKLRLRNRVTFTDSIVGKEYYAIDDISVTGSYVNSGVRDKVRTETRQEAWHLNFSPNTINVCSPISKNSPPAYWTRNVRTKRPVNLENKRINSLGNFRSNYEVLQTSGRRITNNLIVDGFLADSSLITNYVSGVNDYGLPDLTIGTGSKSVIVERFNAPGSKQESSRGALDREGEEMSPNIPLSFRNHYVRRDFYNQLTQSTPQFGGTIHQVNRNRLVRGGKEYFDNGFVTHAIPRSDVQYSWITASSNTTAAQLGGYQSFRRSDSTDFVYNKSEAYTDIDFISGSFVMNDSQEYFVDNSYIKSLVKDKKSIDLNTNLFSIQNPNTSASFSEITNTNHTHTTWTSLRNANLPLSRYLRKNNIVSVLSNSKVINTSSGPISQKRGNTVTNYVDPIVSFKYKPLQHTLSFGDSESDENIIKHDYANQISTFANKELLLQMANEKSSQQFYDLLRSQYASPEQNLVFYKSHKYREIVWPREQNTSLNKTRKRSLFILDQSGFGEDGYDIQLGKQRVFWRNQQKDRQRSLLVDGGYYSSFNYLSTEETGSSFNHSSSNVTTVNEEQYDFTTYFDQYDLDKGFFNSINNLEYFSNERVIFTGSTEIQDSGTTKNIVFKRGFSYENSGEFNSVFIDFYGASTVSGSNTRFDLGSVYRNTLYKSMLTNKPYSFSSERVSGDSLTLIKTEDDELEINPKLRYLAFIGGTELNTGSYITNNFYQTSSAIPSDLFDQNLDQNDVIFSTMDDGLARTTEIDSGKQPFFDTYEDFYEDIRGVSKDYSIVPEFRMSEHMEYYVKDKSANFRATNKSFLGIEGALISSSSSENGGRFDKNFINTYATSDLLKKNTEIETENQDVSEQKGITIEVSGIKKLLPYNGFYPQDRITQIANLYNDFIDNSLGGGVINMSYEDAILNKTLVENHPGTQTTLGTVNSLDIVKSGETFYMALGYHYYNSSTGMVKIFSSTADSISDSTNWSLDKIYTGAGTGYNFGDCCKLVVSGSVVHLFMSQRGDSNRTGQIRYAANTGGTWPDDITIASGSEPGSLFGQNFEAHYLEEEGKMAIAVGARRDSTGHSEGGAVYFITSSDGGSEWSDRITVAHGGGTNLDLGTSVTFLSSSDSNYYIFASQPRKDANSLTDAGTIVVLSSSNSGETWGSADTTDTASLPTIATGSQANTNIGYAGISCVEYGNKTYVFYAEPSAEEGSQTNVGKAYVVYSGPNNDWSTSATNSNTILLAQGTYDYDALTRNFVHYSSIEAVVSNERIYYSFGAINADSPSYSNSGRVYFGNSSDGTNFQTLDDLTSVFGDKVSDFLGPSVSLIPQNGTVFTVYSDKENVYSTSVQDKALSLNLIVSGSDVEKKWKNVAIEPIMGPGILFNTIKSGIAVDWPCCSGSTSTFQNKNGVYISDYYPYSKTMSTHTVGEQYYSSNGSIKSNIGYRAGFQKMLFPNDIFQQKQQITENITEYYPKGSSHPFSESRISDLIDGTYVYGGYEPYVHQLDFGDIDKQAPKRFGIPFVYSRTNGSDSGLYTLAINNFLAECVKFFLREEKMVSFTSSDEDNWLSFEEEKTYYMDVVIKKSEDLIMMESYHSEKHPSGPDGQKMDGRYFGYPVNKTNKSLSSGQEFSPSERRLMHNDPAYAPYTPPYLEGETIARISFKPSDGSRKYSLKEVFAKARVVNIFRGVEQGASELSDAYIHAMPLASSLELFGFANPVKVTINEQTGQRTIENQTDKQSWVISPLMETPVLDFSEQQIVSSSNNYIKNSGFGRGMWSGYGKIPDANKGIKISIQDSFPTNLLAENSLTGSLLTQTGFVSSQKNIGQISEKKDISEALVLIPYLENPIEDYTEEVLKNENIHFIKVDKDVVNTAIEQIETGNITTRTSVVNMAEMSKKYILPPNLDYIRYKDIHPFVMYIVEFNETLEQQDLVDIWQGLMPSISYNAKMDKVSINHDFTQQEFFGEKGIPDKMRWMVFKIKKKSEMNYFNITRDTKDDNRFEFSKILGRAEATDVHSYNWPYDYFSLVEMAKVQIELEYKKK